MKEIILPYHLYQRIKASAGEHGGIGRGRLFTEETSANRYAPSSGVPVCAHGHAWGTCTRRNAAGGRYHEPELEGYLLGGQNDDALFYANVRDAQRIPFEKWCELLNVKCGPKPSAFVEPDPDYRAFQCDAEEFELEKSA